MFLYQSRIVRFIRYLWKKQSGTLPVDPARLRILWNLEDTIGYRFRNWDLLNQAMTHKSYANEILKDNNKHYERIEFLGDAVLDTVISDLLMKNHPDCDEGDLSKRRSSLVNTRSLAKYARDIDLGSYLLLGRGEEQTLGRNKNSILACVFEALLGAVYLDRGFGEAYRVIKKHFEPHMSSKIKKYVYRDFKSILQEYAQSEFKTVPEYSIIGESGPAHEKEFEVSISINGTFYGTGKGKNKKEAQQRAAAEALRELGL